MSIINTKAGGHNAYQFIDLVDVPAFARLLERFFQASGIPNGVVDTNGELLSMSSGENACSVFHCTQSEAADLCRDSNLELVRDLPDGCVAGRLCQNGLMDYVTPVVVEGRQLATLLLGPVLHSPPDTASFRAQALRFGFDEKTYLESIANIPVVDKKQVDDLMEVMVEMAQMLAASGLAKLRQTELERDIRVHAERTIQLREILDFSPVAMGWSENEDRIEYVNRQFTLLFGYTVDDLPNLETWYQRAYPDENYRKTVVGPWRRAVAQAHQTNKQLPELEADITCKDGSVRSIIIRVAWIGNHRMVSFTDITERKRLEKSLIKHELEFRTLAENLPDSIARWDVDSRYNYINSVCERTLDTPVFNVIGKTIPEAFPDGRFSQIATAIAQIVSDGKTIVLARQPAAFENGKTQLHDIKMAPERDAAGNIVSVLGIGRDMTDFYRLQDSLHYSQEMLTAAQKLALLGSWDWNVVDDRIECSEMAYEIYTPDKRPYEPGFEDFKSSLHPDDLESVLLALQLAFERDTPFDLDHRVVSVRKGIRAVHVQGKVFRDLNGKPVRMVGTVQDITERKRMEDALRASEAQFRHHDRLLQAVLESSPEVIVFALDHAYRYLAFNDKHRTTMQAIWGKEIAVGTNMLDVIGTHPDREKARQGFDRALSGEAFVTEDAYGDEAILRLYWQNFFAPIRGEDGSVIGLTCFVLNITERKRMEQALAERERELRTLVENLPDNIARYTTDARHAYVSPSLERVFGKPKEAFLGKTPTECSFDAGNAEVERRIRAVAATGVSDEMEYTFPISDSETRYHLLRFVAERDESNQVAGVLGIGTDITERRRMALILATREREFRTLAEHLPDVVVRYDREARFVYVNTKFEAAIGFGLADVLGKTPTQLPGLPEDAAYFEQLVRQVAETGMEVSAEKEIATLNGGSFYGLIIATPELDNTGQMEFVQVVIRDITERRRVEQRMQAHAAMLEMVARDSDLPTILNALVRYMESEDQTSLCSIMLADAAGKHLLVGAAPSLPVFFNEAANGIEIGVGVGSCGTAAALAQRVVVEDIQTHEYWSGIRELAQSAKLRACWSEPILSSRSKVLGTFAIYHREPQTPQPQDFERIAFATNLAAIAIENRQVHDELARQAHSDYLTGLENRRHFLSQAENELVRTLRYGRELSIMMLDVDHFKQVNDTYGHKVGDLVLKKLAELCRATLRDVDIVGRIGGEEFAVLLPETGSEHARDAAERLREVIADTQVKLDSGLPLRFTASFGVTTLCENDANIDILLDQADQALYRAKNEGRNRVCIY